MIDDAPVVRIECADNLVFMDNLDDQSIKLIVTSPPYNLGKQYEARSSLDCYLENQSQAIAECVRLLHPQGSLCWQVGNYVDNGEIVPLDTVLFPIFRSSRLADAQPHYLALRARIARQQTSLGPIRDDQLVDKELRLHLAPRPNPRAVKVPKQASLSRTEGGATVGQPARQESV